MSLELWHCPNCPLTSRRLWNIKIHIQRKHGGMGQPLRQRNASRQHGNGGQAGGCVRNGGLNSYAECNRIQRILDKLVELKMLLNKCILKGEAEKILRLCCSGALRGNGMLLDRWLKLGRIWAPFKDKVASLELEMADKSISTMLNTAFGQAVNEHFQENHLRENPRYEDYERPRHGYENGQGLMRKDEPEMMATPDADWNNWIDPYYFYFGESEEQFLKGFEAWKRKNAWGFNSSGSDCSSLD